MFLLAVYDYVVAGQYLPQRLQNEDVHSSTGDLVTLHAYPGVRVDINLLSSIVGLQSVHTDEEMQAVVNVGQMAALVEATGY